MWRMFVAVGLMGVHAMTIAQTLEPSRMTHEAPPGSARLVAAAQAGDVRELQVALKTGDADAVDEHGRPLLIAALVAGRRDVFDTLLDAGADPARPDANGQTAVHWAAMNASDWWLQQLLAKGADPNVENSRSGARPLMDAIQSNRADNVTRLLKAGATPDATDHTGATSLHVAARTKYATYSLQLLQAGADPMARNQAGQTFQATQWMGKESILLPEQRQAREGIRTWLKDHHVPIEAAGGGH